MCGGRSARANGAGHRHSPLTSVAQLRSGDPPGESHTQHQAHAVGIGAEVDAGGVALGHIHHPHGDTAERRESQWDE